MKRRYFSLLAGTSLATAAFVRPARAQSATPDPTLLTTTLTPYGAERAGNADGSIPAWTGGLSSPPPPPDQPIDVPLPFNDESALHGGCQQFGAVSGFGVAGAPNDDLKIRVH